MARNTNYSQNDNTITVNIETLKDILQCGRYTAARIAKEAGAEVRIGKRVLYNRQKIENYINSNSGK